MNLFFNARKPLSFQLPLRAGVELRLLQEAHVHELYAVTSANRAYLRRWLPWLDGIQSAWDTRSFIQESLRQAENLEGMNVGLWVDERLAGVLGLHTVSLTHRCASIGYWLAEPYQGRGLMTLAVRGLMAHAYTALNINRIEIRAATGNYKSCAVAERLGFTREGTLRQAEWLYDHFVDHAVYGLLYDDWRAQAR